MKNRLITVIGVLVVVLGACETDIDVNADWKDITTVYSILDPAEKTQYVRINKAFLGEGNALEYAQIADSINYDTSYIEARIDEYLKGMDISEYDIHIRCESKLHKINQYYDKFLKSQI